MGVKNKISWSEIGSGFGEPRGIPPPGNPRSTPRGFISEKGKNKQIKINTRYYVSIIA